MLQGGNMNRSKSKKFTTSSICLILAALIVFTEILHGNRFLIWSEPNIFGNQGEVVLAKQGENQAMGTDLSDAQSLSK